MLKRAAGRQHHGISLVGLFGWVDQLSADQFGAAAFRREAIGEDNAVSWMIGRGAGIGAVGATDGPAAQRERAYHDFIDAHGDRVDGWVEGVSGFALMNSYAPLRMWVKA